MHCELRCIECGATGLDARDADISCRRCGATFPYHPHKRIPVLVSAHGALDRAQILSTPAEPTTDATRAREHWSTGPLAEFLAGCEGKQLLAYASGDASDRRWLESAGYTVTTFDIFPGDFTDYICDGHDLPFADAQFDVVTSLAVFEHLRDPFRAAAEIARVLKPGGALVGSLAFLEAYHGRSYFHMSHLGLTEVLQRAEFRTIQIAPGWSSLESINGSFWVWNRLKPIRRVTRRMNRMKYRLGLSLWKLGYRLRGRPPPDELFLRFCGSLIFKAVK